ncbi:hypothetical protein VKT23_015329 [Stygiomarasmius scandens]|uniref:Uncharacterized protein n=1 Tax=Marasmiellus scandens TaxID=2682957 RepID=A0ABR1IY02_9AGAR
MPSDSKDTNKNNSHSHVGMIVGIALGVAFILLILILILLCRRRFKRSKAVPATTFHRDMMVRSKSDSLSNPELQDSRVFKLDSVTTGIGLIPGKTSISTRRSLSARSSPSVDDDDVDERTPSLAQPSLAHFSFPRQSNLDPKNERTVPVSPTATSIYTSYTQSSDTPYTVVARPKIPARTDRQMQIQEDIMDLRRQMIGTFESRSSPNDELEMLRGRISQLEKLQESDWALELSDIRPPGLDKVGVAK